MTLAGQLIAAGIKILLIVGVIMLGVPMLTWLERKLLADFQARIGPNRVSPFGLLQAFADGIKLLSKEDILPSHVDRLLYLQRMHGRNTQADPKTNATIQEETAALYTEHIESMALAWSGRRGIAGISLTTSTSVNPPELDERFTSVRIDPADPRLPYDADEIGVIKATDILQRVPDRARFLNECHRVLCHGGLLLTDTPSTDGRGAFQDPSHVAFYNENSFVYLTQSALRPTIPTLTARLQVSHLQTYWPSPVHEQMDIPYVKGNLIAVKDGPRQGGPLLT